MAQVARRAGISPGRVSQIQAEIERERFTAHPPASNLVARRLAPVRLVLCGSPDYLRRNGSPRRLEDIGKHACVVFPSIGPRGIWSFRRDGRRYPVIVYLPNRYMSSKVRALIDFLLARFSPTPYWEEGW